MYLALLKITLVDTYMHIKFVLHFAAVSVSCVPIVLQLIVTMFSISVSDMSNNACPFHGTTKRYNFMFGIMFFALLYICLIVLLLFSYMVLVGYLYSLLPQTALLLP